MNTEQKINTNKNLVALIMGGANQLCIDQGIEDLKTRNGYAGCLMEVLEKSIDAGYLILTDEYDDNKDEQKLKKYVKILDDDKKLRVAIIDITKKIFEEDQSFALQVFLYFYMTLPMLLRSKIIKIK